MKGHASIQTKLLNGPHLVGLHVVKVSAERVAWHARTYTTKHTARRLSGQGECRGSAANTARRARWAHRS